MMLLEKRRIIGFFAFALILFVLNFNLASASFSDSVQDSYRGLRLSIASEESKPLLALQYASEDLTKAKELVSDRKSSAAYGRVDHASRLYESTKAFITGWTFVDHEDEKVAALVETQARLAVLSYSLASLESDINNGVASGTIVASSRNSLDQLKGSYLDLAIASNEEVNRYVKESNSPVEAQLKIENELRKSGASKVISDRLSYSMVSLQSEIDRNARVSEEAGYGADAELVARVSILNGAASTALQKSIYYKDIGLTAKSSAYLLQAQTYSLKASEISAGKEVDLSEFSPDKIISSELDENEKYLEDYESVKGSISENYPEDLVASVAREIEERTVAVEVARGLRSSYESSVGELSKSGRSDVQTAAELSKEYESKIRGVYGNVRVDSETKSSVHDQSEASASSDSPVQESGSASDSKSSSSASAGSNSDSSASPSEHVASAGSARIGPSVAGLTGEVIRDVEGNSFLSRFRGWLRRQLSID